MKTDTITYLKLLACLLAVLIGNMMAPRATPVYPTPTLVVTVPADQLALK